MSVIGWNNARISDIRIHQELRTAAGLPINEADDGWKAARSGGVDVRHGNAPFTAYRSYHFRFLSEFGFQSFPCMETIRSFTLPQDRNVFSYVMEMHQRNSGANGKILQYLSQNYLYPGSLELLVYASQLLQADAIRYGVEHLRRSRNEDRCMGAAA